MLAVLVVAVVLCVVLLLRDPLERLGERLQDGRDRDGTTGGPRRARRLPSREDRAVRAERRRLAGLPHLPADDLRPRGAGPAPSSPRALELELRRGLDEAALHLALHALQQRRPVHDEVRPAQHAQPTATPLAGTPSPAPERTRARRDAREDA